MLVTYGDVPLLAGATLRGLVAAHDASGDAVTVSPRPAPTPPATAGSCATTAGAVAAIVEQKDAADEQRAIREINSGIYAFDAALLRDALAKVGTDNAQGEKYLTDVSALARAGGHRRARARVDDVWQTEGVNDRVQLAAARRPS